MTFSALHHLTRTIPALAMLLFITGCESTQPVDLPTIEQYYAQKQYRQAYREASRVVDTASSNLTTEQRYETAYLAGLSAFQLDDYTRADRYLAIAARSSDSQLAGQALAQRGITADKRGQYATAARYLLQAVDKLTGQDKANAYYYAAVAQQKQGLWKQARTHLTMARTHSRDYQFKKQVDKQRKVTGFAIQLGAYRERSNAQQYAQANAARLHRHAASPTRVVQTDDRLYRVYAGQFKTYGLAQSAALRLGNKKPIIVPVTD